MNKKILFSVVFLAFAGAGFAVPFFVLTKDVSVISPHTGSAVEAVYATGTVEPTIMVPIASRTSAHLLELNATEGQEVKKGDVLARLENSEQQATVNDLTAKLSFAAANLARKEKLLRSQSISRDVLDSAKADVESLLAQVEKAKAQANYLTLVAPADGLIIKRDGEVGELIQSGQAIFYLSCCAPMRITAEVDEEDIPLVQIGQNVLIQSDAFPDKVYKGKIAKITPKGDPVARSYRVRISFDDADIPFMIGMTTEANIIIKEINDALLIPAKAIGNKNKVQVARAGTVQTVPITTGIENIDDVQILSGLTPSDSVIVPYDKSLKDGQKIRTKIFKESAK